MLVVCSHRLLFSTHPSTSIRSATLVIAHQELPPVGIPSYAQLIKNPLGEVSLRVVFTHGAISCPLAVEQYDQLLHLTSIRLQVVDPLEEGADDQFFNLFADDVSKSEDAESSNQVLMDMTISLETAPTP